MESIVHLGTTKTGTTLLQNVMRNYDDGHTFWAQIDSWENHNRAIGALLGYPLFDPDPDVDYLTKFSDIAKTKGRQRVIFSAEIISLFPPELVQKYADYFPSNYDQTRFLMYLRDPRAHAVSAFQESLKHIRFKFEKRPSAIYRDRYSATVDAIGAKNIEFAKFSRETMVNGDIVDDFCDRLDLVKPTQIDPNAFDNQSLDIAAQKCLYALGRSRQIDPHSQLVRDHMWRVVRDLRALDFKSGEKLPEKFIEHAACQDDYDWVSEVCDLEFEAPSAPLSDSQSMKLDMDFDYFMRQISNETRDRLARSLIDEGVDVRAQDSVETMMLNMLRHLSEPDRKRSQIVVEQVVPPQQAVPNPSKPNAERSRGKRRQKNSQRVRKLLRALISLD